VNSIPNNRCGSAAVAAMSTTTIQIFRTMMSPSLLMGRSRIGRTILYLQCVIVVDFVVFAAAALIVHHRWGFLPAGFELKNWIRLIDMQQKLCC